MVSEIFDQIHPVNFNWTFNVKMLYNYKKKYLSFIELLKHQETQRNRKATTLAISLRIFPSPPYLLVSYTLTRSAEPRTRSKLRHIDDFYGENLPGVTMYAFPNDAERPSATMRMRR